MKDVYTPSELAEILMVSPVTVRLWAKEGQLKSVNTPGGHRRFLREDIIQFAKDRNLDIRFEKNRDLRILIVDDDISVSNLLTAILEEQPEVSEIATANDGFNAGGMMYSFNPQLVLLDLMMPGMDGFKVCESIKKNPVLNHIRVIAMTGYYVPENIKRIKELGAEACISKPVEIDDLLNVIGLKNSESQHQEY